MGGGTEYLNVEFKYTGSEPLSNDDFYNIYIALDDIHRNEKDSFRAGLDFSSAKFKDEVINYSGRISYYKFLKSFVFPEKISDNLTLAVEWFKGCINLEYVKLPSNLNKLGSEVFKYSAIKAMALNEGLTAIGSSAFNGDTNLEAIEIPGSVTEIGEYAFQSCTSLKKLVLKEGLQTIGSYAFNKAFADDVESFEIPNTVTTICYYAFSESKIKSLKIPSSVTSLGDEIIQNCSKLKSLELNTNVLHINAYYNVLLSGCTELTTLVIGENVRLINKFTGSISNFPNLSSVEFKNPKGWSVSGVGPIPEADLKDPATAAAKVKQYCDKTWTRSDS